MREYIESSLYLARIGRARIPHRAEWYSGYIDAFEDMLRYMGPRPEMTSPMLTGLGSALYDPCLPSDEVGPTYLMCFRKEPGMPEDVLPGEMAKWRLLSQCIDCQDDCQMCSIPERSARCL